MQAVGFFANLLALAMVACAPEAVAPPPHLGSASAGRESEVHSTEPPASSYVGLRFVTLPGHVSESSGAFIEKVDGIDYALQEVWTRAGSMLWLERVTRDGRKTRTFEVLAVLEIPPVRLDERLQFGPRICKTSRGFDPEV